MLLCGIVDELPSIVAKTKNQLSFFFCQGTDSRINHATAVLRGLLYLLLDQQPHLLSHARKKFDHGGKSSFEDVNAWVALSEIFTDVLSELHLASVYLIIDALDECIVDLPKLLDWIANTSSRFPRVKWIVSSRNWPIIEKGLNQTAQKTILSLELNDRSVSAAVDKYVNFKVDWLARHNAYDLEEQHAVQQSLLSKANGTFLWVALVCQELKFISGWEAEEKIKEFPPGLEALYKQMMGQIRKSELCKSILAVMVMVYRPITVHELGSLVSMPARSVGSYKATAEIVGRCGSLLALREHTVSFIHQSAKDFLLNEESDEIFPSGTKAIHHSLFSRSLQAMSETLVRDIYKTNSPEVHIGQVKPPDPDPLRAVRYSCLYWINHLQECVLGEVTREDLQDGGLVDKFLRKKYLNWLEALSLLASIPKGALSIVNLEGLILVRTVSASAERF